MLEYYENFAINIHHKFPKKRHHLLKQKKYYGINPKFGYILSIKYPDYD